MRGGDCVCLWGRGVLLGERGVTEREFTVDWGGISGRDCSVAERSEAKRSGAKRRFRGAKRNEAERNGA